MEIRYFGWSGVTVKHDDVLVGFDLFGKAVKWDSLAGAAKTILCVTHGHPEHFGSLRQFLAAPEAQLSTTHVVASRSIIDYLARAVSLPAANAHRLEADSHILLGDARVSAFSWAHMPLLPPRIGPKITYAAHLLSHPHAFMRIALGGLGLPMRAPMHGFHITFTNGCRVLNYAEGLHRLTDLREVERVASKLPAEVLLFAVEPDDLEAIPRWLEILNPSRVFMYEAHRPWRELFKLPYIDLDAYASQLSTRFADMQFNSLVQEGTLSVE